VAGARIPTVETVLGRGDRVFLFTDGVTESVDLEGRDYGEARLARVLGERDLGARGLVEAVVADVAAYVGEAEPFDDVTCVALIRL
jgi:sigma-B regulation protein RsbU (phosphoserine phosphatase)